MMQRRYDRLVLLTVAVACLGLGRGVLSRASEGAAADGPGVGARLISASGFFGGICVVAGTDDVSLPLAIGRDERFLVHALYPEDGRVREVRQAIRAAGLYGRVSADRLDGPRLPYAENLINLLVVDRWGNLELDEILRVLTPRGVLLFRPAEPARAGGAAWAARLAQRAQALQCGPPEPVPGAAGWRKLVKPWPEAIDEWTHFLHGPDGNPVAQDRRVGPPQRYQWIGGPRWAQSHETDSNLRCLITARGRLYYVVNEAPTSLAGPESPPDKWFLAARDAFNGLPLWKVPIRHWGWRQWKPSWFTPRPGVIPLNLDKRLVAAGDKLYGTLGFRAPVSELDGRTGTVLRTFDGTARTSEILYQDGSLILTVLGEGCGVVKRVDVDSGRVVWESEKEYAGTTVDYYRFRAARGSVPPATVDPTLDIATDGKVVALVDGDSVVGLDFATGRQRWRTPFPLVEADSTAGRIPARGRVWNGAMICSGGVVVHASPHQLAAFSADSGKILWQQPKKFLQHLWYEWQDVFVIDGLVWTWSAEVAREKLEGGRGMSTWPVSLNGYDLRTGSLRRQIPLGKTFKTHHHHRCYRNKATVRYVLASRRGTEYVDLAGSHHSVNNWVRGTCHMGMVPANGLQYAPPHPCQCYIDEKLNGFQALAAGEAGGGGGDVKSEARLERGPAYGGSGPAAASQLDPLRSDWPTYRSDTDRSGSVQTRLPRGMTLLWQARVGRRLGPPISVGNRVFVSLVDEHQLVALDVTGGGEVWRFVAGGRIDSPPTYHAGGLLFGCADGWVYRLRAADGQLAWRLRPGPSDRKIGAFGQLESAWPVHGSVLVTGQTAYFAAGRSSHLDGGLRLLAVAARTGEVLRAAVFQGPRYWGDEIEENYQLPMGLLPDILRTEDGALFMRSFRFDASLARQPGVPRLKIPGGFLDDAYFKRMPWSMDRSGHARVLVFDQTHAYCLRMFDSLQGLDPNVYFTPGKEGYLLFASRLGTGRTTWSQRVPIRGRALVVTEDQLCVAGPPDVVVPSDPLAAFEGRAGGVLRVFAKEDGTMVSEHRLPSPAVFNGAAAANGRLFLSLENGTLACFGPEGRSAGGAGGRPASP